MSRMFLEVQDDIAQGGRTFKLYIPQEDFVTVKLDRFDQALLDDIDHGEPSNTPIADRLLGLETLVRRIEQQTAAPKEQQEETNQ